MIYVISRKYLEKHIAKLVAPNDYIIIDGENVGSNADPDDPISQKYNKVIIRGGFCPERETLNLIRRKQNGKEFSEKKLRRQLKEVYKSKDFLYCAFSAIKAQGVYGVDNDINVFICLPTFIYKEIGEEIAALIQEMSHVDFKFVYTVKDLKATKREILEKSLKKKQLKELNKAVSKAEEKFKLHCRVDDDDDD